MKPENTTPAEWGEPFQRISAAEARRLMEQACTQIVDVRQRADFLEGHIPGSVLIPLYELMDRQDELRRECHVIMVCEVGIKSALAAEIAATAGCVHAYNIEGGLAAWVNEGYPLEE